MLHGQFRLEEQQVILQIIYASASEFLYLTPQKPHPVAVNLMEICMKKKVGFQFLMYSSPILWLVGWGGGWVGGAGH